jgi:alpha-mannosidase
MASRKPVVHLVCNAHIDPIWNWHWEEGALEAISTFRTAADFMDEFPEFVFNHNESLLYEWIEEYDPVLFARIQKLVKAGRWNIAGGWYLQPDCNLPGGETFVRLTTLGLNYFQEKFGVRPQVAYNFDPFGHNGSLPQIIKQGGYGLYIFCRPTEPQLQLPKPVFRWRGFDGSEILGIRPVTGFYGSAYGRAVEIAENGIRIARETGEDVLGLWGMGDHGGGPSRLDLQMLRELAAKTEDVEVRHSTPEAYLKTLKPPENYQVHTGDLQRVFAGCYISISSTKRTMRRCEALLRSAEGWAAMAWWARGVDYPQKKLERAWKGVGFNTFHDILPGSTRQAPCQDVQDFFGETAEACRRVRFKSQLALLPNVTPKPGTVPLYVFNPHAWEMTAPIEISLIPAYMFVPKGYALYDDKGRKVASQRAGGRREDFGNIDFVATVPALSARRYEARLEEEPKASTNPLTVKQTKTSITVENKWLRAKFSAASGGLTSLIEKKSGQDLLRGSVKAVSMKDNLDSWGGEDNADFATPLGEFTPLSGEEAGRWAGTEGADWPSLEVLFEGSTSITIRSLVGWRRSRVCQHFTFFADLPYVDVDLRVHWQERSQCLKWVLPLRLKNPTAVCEVPYATATRAVDGTEQVGGRWVRMEEAASGMAVGVASNGQYSFHARNNGELGLALVRGAIHVRGGYAPAGPAENHDYMDQGQHDFRFRILVGKANAVAKDLVPAAMELNMPLEAFFLYNHPMLPKESPAKLESLVEVTPATVTLSALKKADKGEALILRLNETLGKRTKATVKLVGLAKPIAVELHPFEIKTLRVTKTAQGVVVKESSILEE